MSFAAQQPSVTLDFASLLSRNHKYRPASVVEIVPREALRNSPLDGSAGTSSSALSPKHSHHAGPKTKHGNGNKKGTAVEDTASRKKQSFHENSKNDGGSGGSGGGLGSSISSSSLGGKRPSRMVYRVEEDGIARPLSPRLADAVFEVDPIVHVSADDGNGGIVSDGGPPSKEKKGQSSSSDEDDEDDWNANELNAERQTVESSNVDDTSINEKEEVYYIVSDDPSNNPYQYNSHEYQLERILAGGYENDVEENSRFSRHYVRGDIDEDENYCRNSKKSDDNTSNDNIKIDGYGDDGGSVNDEIDINMDVNYEGGSTIINVVTGNDVKMAAVEESMRQEQMNRKIAARERARARRAEELVYKLSKRTAVCARHVGKELQEYLDLIKKEEEKKAKKKDVAGKSKDQQHKGGSNTSDANYIPLYDEMKESERIRLDKMRRREEATLPSTFHEVELADWELKIDWEGKKSNNITTNAINNNSNDGSIGGNDGIHMNNNTNKNISEVVDETNLDPQSLLSQPFNPSLDALDFSKTVSWEGADAPLGHNAKLSAHLSTLILQQSIAGRSIAKVSGAMPLNSRPEPFNQSSVFNSRMDREMSKGSGHLSGSGNSLQTDPEKREREIAERQKKRAQMAIDKTNRVTEALGTLDMGGGMGRTITSSLMGPGGTERTGRPSRHGGQSSLAHDSEYVEQLELVNNHTLVKADLRKGELQCFHRPKLPRSVFRPGEIRPWQFQVRVFVAHSKLKGKGGRDGRGGASTTSADGSTVVSSYQNSIMGAMPGAISQANIRNEADLSPTEGDLVMLEYCEERPSIQLSKGMASKIVNYFRGDKSKCPISAGGGDRPSRKKKHGDKASGEGGDLGGAKGPSGKVEKPPRLVGPGGNGGNNAKASPADLIGNIGGKKSNNSSGSDGSSSSKDKKKETAVPIIPEGVTEILHPKVHGPFIGEVEDGVTQTGLISNLFAAPMFLHKPRSTDFLMILGKRPSNKHHSMDGTAKLGVVLRTMPTSVFCVGQTEPRVKVFAPNTTGEKNFMTPFITYQIAKALQRARATKNQGLRFDEINDRLFANTSIQHNALRQRIKQVAQYDKNTSIWTIKEVGFEDFPGVDQLGWKFSPEGVAANESSCAAVQRLNDLGISGLCTGSNSVLSVAQAYTILTKAVKAAKDRDRKMSKNVKTIKTSKNKNKTKQIVLYERAARKLEAAYKELKHKADIARFIYEELQLAPWHLTAEFIDVHKHAQGTGMMQLTGLGDPSGDNGGYNFLRVVDAKPNNNSDGALNAQIKTITGTENDLRRLNMKQMADILREYGMDKKQIDTLKRWDRVHVIRDLSTKAASDGMGDGLERYARGEKMKLSDQKQMYRERIQEIWRRQRVALTTDAGSLDVVRGPNAASGPVDPLVDSEDLATKTIEAQNVEDKESSDDSDSDDDFDEELMRDLKYGAEGNQILAAQRKAEADGNDFIRPVTALNQTGEDSQDIRDARELAEIKRQREEERAAQQGIGGNNDFGKSQLSKVNRKVIRRRITKTDPDGTQTTTFKFIVLPNEVDKIMIAMKRKEEKSKETKDGDSKKKKKKSPRRTTDKYMESENTVVGHSMFADDDEIVEAGRIKLHVKKTKTRMVKTKRANIDSAPPKLKKVSKTQTKHKQKSVLEKKMKKRKREAEEKDLYISNAKRKGTSNRRERGSARDRMPHVIMADRLEQIRQSVDDRPGSGPFHKRVNKRTFPKYFEIISEPIDLQAIRDKNQRYEYRTADTFVDDFDLMRRNAIKFNGVGSIIGNEATAIHEYVKKVVAANREEFNAMEEAVRQQLSSGRKKSKNSRASTPKGTVSETESVATKEGTSGNTANMVLDGISTAVPIGDVTKSFMFDGGSDSDESLGKLGL